MELKNKTLSIAVSAVLVFSFFSFLPAYAQTPITYITGFNNDILEVGYSNGQIWALATNGTIGTTARNWLYEVNATTMTIQAIHNVTLPASFSGTGATLGAGTDLWCSPIYCYYSTVRTTGTNGAIIQVATITSGGETKGEVQQAYTGFTTLTGSTVKIDGRYLTSGDVTQIWFQSKSASTTGILGQIDGLSMTLTQSVSTAPEAGNTVGDVGFFAPTVSEWHAFGGLTTAGATIDGDSWDLYTNTIECNIATASGTATQTGANFANYLGTSTNPWLGQTSTVDSPNYGTINGRIPYLAYTNGTAVAFFERDVNAASCEALSEDNYLMADLDLANVGLRTAQFDERDSLFFAQETGASARISVVSFDGLTGTISGTPVVYDTNPAVSQTPINGEFVIMPTLELIMVPETGAGRRIVVLDYSSLAPTPTPTPSDTNLPPEPITGAIGGLLCSSGIIPPDQCDDTTGRPTNDDPETNGTGMFLTWFLFLFTGGIMVGVSRKFNFSLTGIPAEFWLGLVVLIIGIAWQLNWVPDIIFYGMIVGIAGLFAFGLYRNLKGQSGG